MFRGHLCVPFNEIMKMLTGRQYDVKRTLAWMGCLAHCWGFQWFQAWRVWVVLRGGFISGLDFMLWAHKVKKLLLLQNTLFQNFASIHKTVKSVNLPLWWCITSWRRMDYTDKAPYIISLQTWWRSVVRFMFWPLCPSI